MTTPTLKRSLSDTASGKKSICKTSILDKFVTKTTAYEKNILDEEVAKMIFFNELSISTGRTCSVS